MLDDVRLAWRRLLHAPGFTIAAILTLGLAIGADTAILSIADAVLFRPLPYADADRVCILEMWHRPTRQRFTMVDRSYLDAINDSKRATSETALLERSIRSCVFGPE